MLQWSVCKLNRISLTFKIWGISDHLVYEVCICFHALALKMYGCCEEAYRLQPEGTIHVPREAVDEYCTGPCLAETELVLKCIDSVLHNFRFYNGASLRDVRYTLETGCGHGERRGKAACIPSSYAVRRFDLWWLEIILTFCVVQVTLIHWRPWEQRVMEITFMAVGTS